MSIELDANIEVVCTHPGEEEGLQCAEVLVKRNVPETEDDSVPEIRGEVKQKRKKKFDLFFWSKHFSI